MQPVAGGQLPTEEGSGLDRAASAWSGQAMLYRDSISCFLRFAGLYALLKGGAPERIGASDPGIGSVLTVGRGIGPGGPLRVGRDRASFSSMWHALVAFLILALRANRFWPLWIAALATHRDRGPRREAGGPGRHPQGLRVRPGVLELSDAAPDRAGDLAPSAAVGQVRCRQILVELLGPFGAAARGWADGLVDEFGSLAAVLAASPDALARTVDDDGAVRQLRRGAGGDAAGAEDAKR